MAQHTPGPWATAGRFAPVYVVDAQGHTIADCDQIAGLPDRDAPHHIANARLIAAAPDMLRLLREIREDMLCGGQCRHIPSGVQGDILAVISKAEG